DLVVKQLIARCERVDDGVTWTTPVDLLPPFQRSIAPLGYRNLGVAHGVPGVIALLARIQRIGALPEAGVRGVEGAVQWVLAQQAADDGGPRYAPWIRVGPASGQRGTRARAGWCYGDLGVAATLLLAGRCLGRSDWSRAAVDMAKRLIPMDPSRMGV